MTVTMIGRDSDGIGVIKITAANYDPETTPDTDYYKWKFNSKWDMNVRFVGSDIQSVQGGTFRTYYPAGTGPSNFKRLKFSDSLGYNNVFWKASFFQEQGQLDYELPLFDLKPIASNGWTIYCSIQRSTGSTDTKWYNYSMLYAGWAKDYYLGNGSSFPLDGVTFTALCAYCETSTWGPGTSVQAIVYNLPGDDTAILYPAITPVSGQQIAEISSTRSVVAKPGYDVNDIAAKLAFDSTTRPAKVIASGDIAIPGGTTVFDFTDKLEGINVDTASLVVDVLQYKGSTISFPCNIPNDEDDFGAAYRINGTTLEFSNGGSSVRARFIVIAQDNSAPSVGANDVLRQVTIGGENVVQFLRPGAANPPNLADVIIDSRWPCLQIIKEGWFDIPSSGGAAANTDITFDSTGLFPFIKFHTVHPAGLLPYSNSLGTVNSPAQVSKIIRAPQAAAGFYRNNGGPKNFYISGETAICQLTTDRARFVTYRGGPYRIFDNGGGDIVTRAVRNPATKIRYYIFGIPA